MTIDMILAIMYYGKTTHPDFIKPVEVEDILETTSQLYPSYNFTLKDLREALEYDFDMNVTTKHIFVGGDDASNYQDVIDMLTDASF